MRILVIIAMLLTGCGGQSEEPLVSRLQTGCRASERPFVDYWPCIRAGMAEPDNYPDIKALYIATGDYVSEQVRDGKMTDAEAKLAMAAARQKAASEVHARSTASASASAAGYAAWNASRPRTCVRHGYIVNCY